MSNEDPNRDQIGGRAAPKADFVQDENARKVDHFMNTGRNAI